MKQKNIYFYTNLLAWGLVLFLIGNYVFGWTTPTANPPEGDLSAPLDISSTAQTKTGNLTIDSLLKVGRYSSAPTGATGALYYDTTENEFKGYKASSWDSLGEADTDTWITTQTCAEDYALQSVGKTTKTCINKVDYSDIAYGLSCTDCIGTTEIADSYVLNTSDTMSGTLTVGSTLTVDGAITSPEGTLRDDGGGWVRTYGSTGWYSQTYGGGWYMTDTTYLRTYNSKQIYSPGGIHMGNAKITNLAAPTADADAATKAYVDSAKFACRQVEATCSDVSSCKAVCNTDEKAFGGLCAQGGQTNSYLTQAGNCNTYSWCCYWNSSQTYNRYARAWCCK